jgi:hypothetical protein
LKRLRTLLSGGLPAALSGNGGLKVEQVVAGPTQPVSAAVASPVAVRHSDGAGFIDPRDRNRGAKRYGVANPALTTALATTVGEKPVVTFWHPATSTKTIYIWEINIYIAVAPTAGTFALVEQFISAENGVPAGTQLTPQPFNRADAASDLVVRTTPALPTKVGQLLSTQFRAAGAVTADHWTSRIPVLAAADTNDPVVLRAGVAEGFYVYANVLTALTGAPQFLVEAFYEEV